MEAKAEQDKMDERNGLVVFIHGEGVKRIKAATSEKLIDQLLDPTQPGNPYSFERNCKTPLTSHFFY